MTSYVVKTVQKVFKTSISENGEKGWEFPLPDEGQAADSRREVSQAQHFSCLCILWFRLVEAGNYTFDVGLLEFELKWP